MPEIRQRARGCEISCALFLPFKKEIPSDACKKKGGYFNILIDNENYPWYVLINNEEVEKRCKRHY